MAKQVLFIQGGGGEEDYVADAALVASLREALGEGYEVHYPFLPSEAEPDFGRVKQLGQAVSLLAADLILVGHSLGASMLLKFLSQTQVQTKITGIFLLATPFWQGDEEWKQALKLPEDFADHLPKNVPIFLYHCQDDEEVPFTHLRLYAQALPQATVRPLPNGDHLFNHDLSLVAKDIKAL